VGSLLAQVALYGLAAAFAAPIALVVSAMILGKSTRPVVSGWVFVAGAFFLDLVFTIVVFASGVFDSEGDLGAYVDVGLGLLFAAMGVMAVFAKESPESDAKRRARADSIASGTLGRLFAAGFLVQVINFDAIAVFGGALKEIAKADVTTAQAVIATAFGLALMLSVYYVPVVIYMVSPERAKPLLGRVTEWIMANSRALEIVVGLGFGAVFLYKGLVVLL
jgi:hypothetical protein